MSTNMDPKDIGRPKPPTQRDEEDGWMDDMDQRFWSEMGKLRDQGKLRAASTQEEISLGVHEARDRTLLAGLVRTAHENPDLRPLLLPVIKEAVQSRKVAKSRTVRKRISVVLYPEDFRNQGTWHQILDDLGLPWGWADGRSGTGLSHPQRRAGPVRRVHPGNARRLGHFMSNHKVQGAAIPDDPFAKKVEALIKKHWPKSTVNVSTRTSLGGKGKQDTLIRFALWPKSDWPNGIEHNDPAYHQIWIWDSGAPVKSLELSVGGALYGYSGTKLDKIGWRNGKGDETKVLRALDTYFGKKLKMVVEKHKDALEEKLKMSKRAAMDPKTIGQPKRPAQRDPRDGWMEEVDQRQHSEMQTRREQGKLRSAYTTTKKEWQQALKHDEEDLAYHRKMLKHLEKGEQPPGEPNITLRNCKQTIQALEQVIKNKKALISKLGASTTPSDRKLLGGLIRLAHSTPDLQPHLLPVIQGAVQEHRTAKTVTVPKKMVKALRTAISREAIMGNRRSADSKLLGGLIRTAHANADLRPHLLPLIRSAGKIKGPGQPDGTGPCQDSPDCPQGRTAKTVRDMKGAKVGPWTVKVGRNDAGGAVLRASKPMLPPLTMKALDDAPDLAANIAKKFPGERGDVLANHLYLSLLDLDGRARLSGRVTAAIGLSTVPDVDPNAVGNQGKPLKLYPWIEFDASGSKPPENPTLTDGDLKKLDQAATKFHGEVVKVLKQYRDEYAKLWGLAIKVRL